MLDSREIVITGLGVVSPIGVGKDAFWASLSAGKSGVGPLVVLRDARLPVPFGGEVTDFEPKNYVQPRKSLKVMCREIQAGFSAAAMAVADAGIASPVTDPDRFGVVMGTDMFYCTIDETEEVYRNCVVEGKFDYERWGTRSMSDLFPLWMLKHLPNMVACHIGIFLDARGPNNTVAVGEASSLLAIIEAMNVLSRGHADVMIAGGTGSRLSLTPMMYRGDANLSHRADNPAAACRPFDAQRDGMVNGEGAAAFILETRAHAEGRGAKILARLLGYGRTYETGQSEQSIAAALRGALATARLSPADVGHVNAHGISIVLDDAVEAAAIRQVLDDVPVTAVKSYFGNLGGGGGAVELAASILSFAHGEVPRTLNYEHPDPRCPVNVIHGASLRSDKPTAVALNKSGTGQTTAVAVSGPN
jgi:3-oxoacyl-[acyl-carrier-protein] synthase II